VLKKQGKGVDWIHMDLERERKKILRISRSIKCGEITE
jgi:hypothetical protein